MENLKKPLYERQKAIALSYDPDDIAPKILAKGVGVIAQKIMENAVNSDVYIHKDPELVKELTRMDIGDHIPEELYEVVAQILIFINELDSQKNDFANTPKW